MTEYRTVSIIMPIRNEAGFIGHTLNAVLKQDYPAELIEIIVADGMSTDGTRELLLQMSAENPRLICVDNPEGIVPTGFNRALRVATGDIIVRVDGHTIISPDYVRCCVSTLARTNAQNVGGRMTPIGKTRLQRAIAFATTSPFGVGGGRFHYSEKEEWVNTVYMGAWPREVFQSIGGFDEEQVRNQDDEFNYRLRDAGGRIYLNPKISSVYAPRASFKALWRQYFQYGYWKVRVLQKHPRQMSAVHFVPPAFVLALLISLSLSFVSPLGQALLLVGAAAYGTAMLAAAVHRVRGEQKLEALIMPFALAVIHIAWGSGFLVGLIRFSNRWKGVEFRLPRGMVQGWSDQLPARSASEG